MSATTDALEGALDAYKKTALEQLKHDSILMRFMQRDPVLLAEMDEHNKMVRDVYGTRRNLHELRDAIDALAGIKRDVFGHEIEDDDDEV